MRRSVPRPALALLGSFVALVAAWLVPQRTDATSAIILAGVFGVGAALAAPVVRRPRPSVIGGAFVALVVIAVAGSRGILLGFSVGAVFVAAIVSRFGRFGLPARAALAQRHARERARRRGERAHGLLRCEHGRRHVVRRRRGARLARVERCRDHVRRRSGRQRNPHDRQDPRPGRRQGFVLRRGQDARPVAAGRAQSRGRRSARRQSFVPPRRLALARPDLSRARAHAAGLRPRDRYVPGVVPAAARSAHTADGARREGPRHADGDVGRRGQRSGNERLRARSRRRCSTRCRAGRSSTCTSVSTRRRARTARRSSRRSR